jgi:hypothetical protein
LGRDLWLMRARQSASSGYSGECAHRSLKASSSRSSTIHVHMCNGNTAPVRVLDLICWLNMIVRRASERAGVFLEIRRRSV